MHSPIFLDGMILSYSSVSFTVTLMMNQLLTQSDSDAPRRTAQEDTAPLLDTTQLTVVAASETEMTLIPVVEEQLDVTKRVVETGRVRLVKTVEEYPQTVSTTLTGDAFDVERISVQQYVQEAPSVRVEGETTIYPVLREVVVVEKRLLLVEEIHVTKRQTKTTDEQTVNLRREVVTVERSSSADERSV